MKKPRAKNKLNFIDMISDEQFMLAYKKSDSIFSLLVHLNMSQCNYNRLSVRTRLIQMGLPKPTKQTKGKPDLQQLSDKIDNLVEMIGRLMKQMDDSKKENEK
jgi:hypothetical protein